MDLDHWAEIRNRSRLERMATKILIHDVRRCDGMRQPKRYANRIIKGKEIPSCCCCKGVALWVLCERQQVAQIACDHTCGVCSPPLSLWHGVSLWRLMVSSAEQHWIILKGLLSADIWTSQRRPNWLMDNRVDYRLTCRKLSSLVERKVKIDIWKLKVFAT